MDTFDFPYHIFRIEYPPNAPNIQLGGGYTFASKPKGPLQRKFILSFATMVSYQNVDGTPDIVTNPSINFLRLDQFYKDHGTHEVFIYPSELYGNIEVRFAEPFKWPKGMVGGRGAVEAFEVPLIENMS